MQTPHRHRCGALRRDWRAWLRCPWAVAGPGRATYSDPAPLVWKAPEGPRGQAAVPVGGGGAWPGFETTHRSATRRHWCGGRRRDRRARAGFEIDHSERSSRVAISRAAGPSGARNTSGATSNTINEAGRRPRRSQAPRPGHSAPGTPARDEWVMSGRTGILPHGK